MKTITKEYNVLEISDIEKAVSDYTGVAQSINDMRGSLVYYLSDDFKPKGMSFVLYGVSVGDSNYDSLEDLLNEACFVNGTLCAPKSVVSSYDLFYDEEKKGHYLNGKQLSLDEPWLHISEVFNFDVSAFRSFESHTEWYD